MQFLAYLFMLGVFNKGEFSVAAVVNTCDSRSTTQTGSGSEHGLLNPTVTFAKATEFPSLQYNGHFGNCLKTLVQNNGVMVTMKPWGEQKLNTNISISDGPLNGTYILHQANFNWGTNTKYPVELHMYHFAENYKNIDAAAAFHDGIAIVVFIFEIQTVESGLINEITKMLPKLIQSSTTKLIDENLLTILIPYVTPYSYYTYTTTTETVVDRKTCFKNVIWIVYNKTIPIKQAEVNLFTNLKTNKGSYIKNNLIYLDINGKLKFMALLAKELRYATDVGYRYKDSLDWLPEL